MIATKNLANYVRRLCVNLSDLSRATGIPYSSLYRSIGVKEPKRDLKADELLEICDFFGINPSGLNKTPPDLK